MVINVLEKVSGWWRVGPHEDGEVRQPARMDADGIKLVADRAQLHLEVVGREATLPEQPRYLGITKRPLPLGTATPVLAVDHVRC